MVTREITKHLIISHTINCQFWQV